MIVVMILIGFLTMYCAIYTKDKDIEILSFYGVTDLLLVVVNIFFNLSSIRFKRILIFLLGILWTGLFLFILISGRY